jgi:hypothetical protein
MVMNWMKWKSSQIYGSTIVIATLLTTLWLPFSNHKDGTDIRIHRLDYTTTVPSFQSFAD